MKPKFELSPVNVGYLQRKVWER